MLNKLFLKSEIQLLENLNGELKIRLGNKISFSIYKNKSAFKAVFEAFESGISYAEILDNCNVENKKAVIHFLKFFENNNFLTENANYGVHDRQIRYFSLFNHEKDNDEFKIQNRIHKSSILIVGLGGIGTHLACCLASSGIGKIGLCDFDIVEASNISRCIGFTKNDIGNHKPVVLKKFLTNIYDNTLFEIYVNKIQVLTTDILSQYDFIIISIDKTKQIENELETLFLNLKIPFIFSNYGEQYGMISKINFSTKENKNPIEDAFKTINNTYKAPSVFWNSMVIAGVTSKEVLAYLSKSMTSYSKDFRININLDNLSFNLE